MEEPLKELARYTALAVEGAAILLIAYGAAEALAKTVAHVVRGRSAEGWRRDIFVKFGVWLLLGLQFALGADIVRSVITQLERHRPARRHRRDSDISQLLP